MEGNKAAPEKWNSERKMATAAKRKNRCQNPARFPWPWSPLDSQAAPSASWTSRKDKDSYFQGTTTTHSAPDSQSSDSSAEQKSKNNAACWNLKAESWASPRLRSSNTEGVLWAVVLWLLSLLLLFPTPTEACGVGTEVSAVWGTVCSRLSWRNSHGYFGHLKLRAKVYRKK